VHSWAQAEQAKQKQPTLEGGAHALRGGLVRRTLADSEIEQVSKMQADAWQKLKDEIAKKTPPGRTPPAVPPRTSPQERPVQPAEQKVRTHYQSLLTAFPDLALAGDARLELAEVQSDRERYDEAIKLLKDSLDKEPPLELGDRMRIRLGSCLSAKGDHKAALTHFQLVAGNVKSPLCRRDITEPASV
jgi:tetratricopeptide (TPR) repeat protein